MDQTLSAQVRNQTGMSYKFQRLREKIRSAVVSGELTGKLPGERELARRFSVNAKTLSKALTDLAAEGLLQRSIGRGTFVKGSAPKAETQGGRWLVVVDPLDSASSLIKHIQLMHPSSEVIEIEDVASLRPSFLSQFSAVVDLSSRTPDSFKRDLLVRNIAYVTVGQEPRTYSTNAVLMDVTLSATHLTRELILDGHRHFVAIEERNHSSITEAIRRALARYAPDATVDPCFPGDLTCAIDYGATAAICDSVRSAKQAMAALAGTDIAVPQRMSIAAIGWGQDDYPCTGYYVETKQKAQAIVQLIQNGQNTRPTTLWLAGTRIDRATTTYINESADSEGIDTRARTTIA